MTLTTRNAVLALLAAYQNEDVPADVRKWISDIARQHPDIIPEDLREMVQGLQQQEVEAFFATDPTTWGDGENKTDLVRNVKYVLENQGIIDPGSA